jgi:RNA polymerase sigma-70 factor, ECF subfamily
VAVPGNGEALSDEMLAGRAGRGDAAALSLLLDRWWAPLERYCRRLIRHDEDARDLAQDAVLRAARAIASFDAARPFAPWIYRIAKNACLNHLDRESYRQSATEPPEQASPAPPPEIIVARREDLARIRVALRQLGREDRELLRMKLVLGLGNPEIATRLGIGKGALRTRASRALQRLRRAVDAAAKEEGS